MLTAHQMARLAIRSFWERAISQKWLVRRGCQRSFGANGQRNHCIRRLWGNARTNHEVHIVASAKQACNEAASASRNLLSSAKQACNEAASASRRSFVLSALPVESFVMQHSCAAAGIRQVMWTGSRMTCTACEQKNWNFGGWKVPNSRFALRGLAPP